MDNLDLKTLGVQELDNREMVETDGGWVGIVIGALIGVALTQDLDRLKEAYKTGYDAA